MDWFDTKGHLTDAALDALLCGDILPEVNRLEVSEHLAYCDACLSRYTLRLTEETLLTPAVSCQKTLWQRIRLRTLRMLTSRYATAAAGVALMMVVLWSGVEFNVAKLPNLSQNPPALLEQLQEWPAQWTHSLGDAFSHITGLFAPGSTAPQGGTH